MAFHVVAAGIGFGNAVAREIHAGSNDVRQYPAGFPGPERLSILRTIR